MRHLARGLWFNEVNNVSRLGTGTALAHKQLPLLWRNTSPLSSEVQGPWRFIIQWNIVLWNSVSSSFVRPVFTSYSVGPVHSTLFSGTLICWDDMELCCWARENCSWTAWSLKLMERTTWSTYTEPHPSNSVRTSSPAQVKCASSLVQQIYET